jgi:hypothetical protein
VFQLDFILEIIFCKPDQVGGFGVDWLNRNGRSVIRIFAEAYVGTPLTYSGEHESNSVHDIFSGIT